MLLRTSGSSDSWGDAVGVSRGGVVEVKREGEAGGEVMGEDGDAGGDDEDDDGGEDGGDDGGDAGGGVVTNGTTGGEVRCTGVREATSGNGTSKGK